jgi:hypothetical protein
MMTLFIFNLHHHVTDGLSQSSTITSRTPPHNIYLSIGRSRLRSLRPERHITLDITIHMSSSEFFQWGKPDFLCIHPLVKMTLEWRPVLTGFYFSIIACAHRHNALCLTCSPVSSFTVVPLSLRGC